MTKAEMEKQEKQWRAESDVRTLIDASKILNDSERKKAAMAEAKKQEAALKEVTKKT